MQQAPTFNANHISIKPISLLKAKFARGQVFAPNDLDGTVSVEQDGVTGTIHYGVFHRGFLVGGVTLVKEPLDGKIGFGKLCYLSIAPNFHQHGLGEMLLQAIVERARNHKDALRGVWLSCPAHQVEFFIKSGFSAVGPLTHDQDFGQAQKMLILFNRA